MNALGTIAAAYWNGEPCEAERVLVQVGPPERPTWWCADLVGQSRHAVEVRYGGESFYLDDEDGSGIGKVTIGRGSPWIGHRSLPVARVIQRNPTSTVEGPRLPASDWLLPPTECHEGAVWQHKDGGTPARITRVHFNADLGWRVVLKGGSEFTGSPKIRAVPAAFSLTGFLRWWHYVRE